MKFYCTTDKQGRPRHVVVATGDEVEGKIPVERLGFHPSVEGVSKRGRPPNLLEPVEVSTLVEMEAEDLPQEILEKAEALFAPPAHGDDEVN